VFVENLWVVDRGVRLGGLSGRVGSVCDEFKDVMGGILG